MTPQNSEFGIRNSEWRRSIPHSAFRIPHFVAGAGIGVVVVFLLTMLMPATAFSCPGCKEALFDPGQLPQKLSTAKGYALSIGLLLAVPVALVGGLTAMIIRSARRKRLS
jgi:hypothetical protein